eukprot:2030610-Pyramimonas_sp.AAC.1
MSTCSRPVDNSLGASGPHSYAVYVLPQCVFSWRERKSQDATCPLKCPVQQGSLECAPAFFEHLCCDPLRARSPLRLQLAQCFRQSSR